MPRVIFGDEASAIAYARKVKAAKACQRVPLAVAPDQVLVTKSRRFQAGDEVSESDLDVISGVVTPYEAMTALIAEGTVIRADHPRRKCANPIGTISEALQGGITSLGGILCACDDVAREDFDPHALEALIAKGTVVRHQQTGARRA